MHFFLARLKLIYEYKVNTGDVDVQFVGVRLLFSVPISPSEVPRTTRRFPETAVLDE
jgi:hypothetical protein